MMSPEDYRLLVNVAGNIVRSIAITSIETVALTEPDPAHPTLHRVVIRTMGRAESVFFFQELDKAELLVTNILEGKELIQQVRVSLHADINQHLLHPDQRS